MRLGLAVAAVLALGLPVHARAADPCTGDLSPAQILQCLGAPPKTRGFPGQTRGIGVEGQQAPADEATVNLMVSFDFDSARLTNDGMISLDALGKALSDPTLRGMRFQIAGHTDAVGADDYNQRLSEARAHSVLDYLVAHYQLPASGFAVVGFGKTQLYDPNDPTGAINRRVQVTRLAAGG